MNIIVDINNAFHKSYHILKAYSADKLDSKSLLEKFIQDFSYSIRLFNKVNKLDKIICCIDSETNFRTKFFPGYKSNREKKDIFFYEALNAAERFLINQGFIVTKIDGFEADDCIGLWCKQLKHEMTCILSADEDIRQLIDENIYVYNNNSKYKMFYLKLGSKQVYSLLGVNAIVAYEDPFWVLFKKMIFGCEGDMVPRLMKKGVGEIRLKQKLFDKHGFDNLTNLEIFIKDIFNDNISSKSMSDNLMQVKLGDTAIYGMSQSSKFINYYLSQPEFTYNGDYHFIV